MKPDPDLGGQTKSESGYDPSENRIRIQIFNVPNTVSSTFLVTDPDHDKILLGSGFATLFLLMKPQKNVCF